ncbi:MAG TPA: TetR/AcrR family transcriptional regulator C-terminal domain-containing protein [Solirubrobacterales bacterium]|jgi:AcrR family transcriptional regulator
MASQIQTPWSKPPPERPAGLSREAIVAAAVELADAEGIEAVSIRRIAAKLEARPMSLYTHIEHKGELIDLMVDEAMGAAVLPGEVPEDWREALRQIAQRTRAAARAHPWSIALAFRRSLLGPKSLHHIDQSLAAVSTLDLPFERKRAVLLAIDTYTLGYVRWEVLNWKDNQSNCANGGEYSQEQIDAYLAEQVASGEYPHLAAIAASDLTLGVKAESFEAGLEWLLGGIAAEVEGTV